MEEDLKQAYETLGLPENVSREDVEKRYFLLVKRAKSNPQSNMEDITRAYKRILGHELDKEAPAEKQSKLNYFFYYYKWHTIAVILVLIVAIVTVKDIVERRIEEANKPPLDLQVTVYGNYFTTDSDRLSQNLLALMPEWKRIDVLLTPIPKEIGSEQDMALQQKGMLTIITEKIDLLILDEPNFEILAKQGAFVQLDTLDFWPELQRDPDRIRTSATEENPDPKPYGLDITGHPALAGTQIEALGEKQILTVRAAAKNMDHALQMLRLLAAAKS